MERCKGSRDFLPADMVRFRYVEDSFRECCRSWGYQEVRTPIMEYLHLFTSTGTLTPSRLGQVYSFLDWDGWSGERVVLRPEGTIPAVRLYMSGLPEASLQKLCYVENVFRFEESGKESRERWQCGVELIGSARPAADAELILLASDLLRRLGLGGAELRLSHVGLLRALLQESGLDAAEQHEAMDKVLDGDVAVLQKALEADPRTRAAVPLLFEMRGKAPGFLRNVKTSLTAALPALASSLDDFIAVADLLGTIEGDYRIDITSGMGFEYYTGITFQFFRDGRRLGAGGRYNGLVPLLGGGQVPASGFAFDMDQLVELAVIPESRVDFPRLLVRSEAGDSAAFRAAVETAARLRREGLAADLDVGNGRRADHPRTLVVRGAPGSVAYRLEDSSGGVVLESSSLDKVLEGLRQAR